MVTSLPDKLLIHTYMAGSEKKGNFTQIPNFGFVTLKL